MSEETVFEKLMKDKDFERLMAQEDLIMDATEILCKVLEENGVQRSSLARVMGKTKGYISQILNSGRNLTLRSLADVAFHLGYKVKIDLRKENFESEEEGYTIKWNAGSKKRPFVEEFEVADDYSSPCPGIDRLAS